MTYTELRRAVEAQCAGAQQPTDAELILALYEMIYDRTGLEEDEIIALVAMKLSIAALRVTGQTRDTPDSEDS